MSGMISYLVAFGRIGEFRVQLGMVTDDEGSNPGTAQHWKQLYLGGVILMNHSTFYGPVCGSSFWNAKRVM